MRLESVLDKKLDELKAGTSDSELLQHNKIQEFNQRMWQALNPGKIFLLIKVAKIIGNTTSIETEVLDNSLIN